MQSQEITVSEHTLTIYFQIDTLIPECVQFYDIDKVFIHYKSKKKELIPTRKQIYCISDCFKKQIKSKEYDNKQSIPNEALENALGKLEVEMREIKNM